MSNTEGIPPHGSRVWEIDFVRGVAIILMVVFHLLWDLREYAGVNLVYWDEVKLISNGAVVFMFISAISSGFSKKPFKRGLMVFAVGLGITAVTYFFNPDTYVRFGILHYLGITMMLFPLLKKLNNNVLASVALLSVIIGLVFADLRVDSGLLLPLGIRYNGFKSIDYYPLFPYLAATLLGVIAYKEWYVTKQSLFPFYWNIGPIQWVSRHALVIYLVHQPVIIAIIYLLV